MTVGYAWRLVTRNGLRSLTSIFGLTLAVGLFSGILFFVDTMTRSMTEKALAPVTLDLVAHATGPAVDSIPMAGALSRLRGMAAAEPLISADFASATRPGSGLQSSTGRLFAVAPSWLSTFGLVRLSEGAFAPDGLVVSETMAVAQKLRVGDRLSLAFAGVDRPVELPITGIANLEGADALFASANEAENALVADVVFADLSWFVDTLEPPLARLALDPSYIPPPGSIVLDRQIHLKIDRSALPADPARAAVQADALRRSIERQYPGELKAIDNVSGALTAAKSDVLSAKILFIFLGLPGVLLAAYLSTFAAELFAEARRRELGLLRSRGARPSQIIAILALSSLFLAFIGSALGLLLGLALVSLSGITTAAGLIGSGAFLPSALLSFAAGLVLTFTAGFIPSLAALRREVLEDRKAVPRSAKPPFWKRAWLDLGFLGLSIGVLAVTMAGGGFKPSGNEGQAVQLSFYIFLAPLLAWVGLTLLTMRLVEAYLRRRNNGLPVLFRALLGGVGEMAAKSLPRRSRALARAATVISLTLSFGISLIIFQATYDHEKRLDSQYIVGADIRVTPALNSPRTADFAKELELPGVSSVTAVVRDTQALVGMEKNTVYGIDVPSFRTTAYLPDSFFVDGNSGRTLTALRDKTTDYAPGSAQKVLDDLASTANGVIISVEQAQKYNIQLGDPVLLRLHDRITNGYRPAEAKAVGFFVYFPTSSQDSDFILNSGFMTAISGNPAIDSFLVKTGDDPTLVGKVAADIAARYRNVLPLRVVDTETVIKVDSSSMTSLNLGGLGLLELIYTILVATIGLGVFLSASVNERRREFGTMRAFGADLGHLGAMLASESLAIALPSLVLGAFIGLILAGLFVLLLSAIFTIPPQALSLPYAGLAGLVGLVLAAMSVGTVYSARRLGRVRVVEALREL